MSKESQPDYRATPKMGYSTFGQYFHTLRYLKVKQVFYRVWYKFKKSRLDFAPAPLRGAVSKSSISFLAKCFAVSDVNQATFLNETHDLSSPLIWNDSSIEKLWLYNLHYFNGPLSKEFISRWCHENPAGKGVGWEPYPTSLRVVNWIKWDLLTHQLSDEAVQNLAVQIRFLDSRLELHLLGNHLLANIKALIFAGLYFKNEEANRWLRKGLSLLDQQISEQILADGGHFELSPMYHAVILEDFLDIIHLCQIYNQPVPKVLINAAEKMLSWLNAMTHPDGEISFFNDSTFKISQNLQTLSQYAHQLGIGIGLSDNKPVQYLAKTGYCRLNTKDAVIIADVGNIGPDYLPGHAHADTLSFEMSLDGQRLFVNSGISCYGLSDERLYQRGTSAHNTARIDQQNSSEVWSGFRVARRAYIQSVTSEVKDNMLILSANHNGYRILKQPVIHQRTWKLKENELNIIDELTGKGQHLVEIYLHLHPDIISVKIENECVYIQLNPNRLIKVSAPKGWGLSLEDSFYYPEFGRSIPNRKIVLSLSTAMPATSTINITW